MHIKNLSLSVNDLDQ